MKENKLSWSELRKLVAKRANVSEKETGLFMNALVEQIIAGLKADGQVRITGLGMFKLQPVAARKSVNVTTGEPIIIEGYNKLNFVPEIGVRELVSDVAPITAAKVDATQDENTPLQKLSAQASEIVDLLADLGQHPTAPKEKKPEPVSEPEHIVEPEPVSGPEKVEQAQPVAYEVKPLDMPIEKESKTEKKYHPLRDGLITIAIILILLVIGYFFLTKQIVKFADGLLNRNEAQTEVVSQQTDIAVAPVAEVEEEVFVQPQTTNEDEQPVITLTKERVYTNFITTENLHADSRLAWLAYKYYNGKKDLWVFIYEANRDRLDNPHKIEVGTPIRIPKLSNELMDLNNPQTRQLVDELIARYQ